MATETSLSIMEVINAAETLKSSGAHAAAEVLYTAWVSQNPEDPLLYAVLFNQAVLLSETGKLAAARECLERSIALKPDFHPSYINLGRVLEEQGEVGQAIGRWNTILEQTLSVNAAALASRITALNQIARLLEATSQDELAETMLRQSLELDPHQSEVIQHYIALRQRQCEWPALQVVERVHKRQLVEAISPLSGAALSDDPLLQLAVSAAYNRRDVGTPAQPMTAWPKAMQHDGPLRIGYLSSDLREHAVGYLMTEVLGLHDRSAVEIFAYDCGPASDDPLSRNFRATTDHWRRISELNDADAARLIANDGIQILVDVNGYTREGRTQLVSLRPAPVIVNWLGYPGTLASPAHHYIIADGITVPEDAEDYYSEKVVRLPCYQPNSRDRVLFEGTLTRSDFGLPEEETVFCCFNGSQKITPHVMDRWLTILAKVPGSVLWLLTGGENTDQRLRSYAETKGVSGDRLVFAGKLPNAQHLARYPLADLFLDTSPYGAHTTASDALWMGVPVLTVAGRCFAARVCASLVDAAGLPDLICETPDQYVQQAVALGRDRSALDRLKQQLRENRSSCRLFDTPGLVKGLETLYAQMWGECLDGRLPQPDLADLEALMDVAARMDHEGKDMLSEPDYRGLWARQLAARHVSRPMTGPRIKRLMGAG
ncbi:O-linked N-acetylglucosamine transferase, SPINDLY family protein [Roseibium suaedae]|uniref:protein O-GlcNAc transferase n=1 Tax=Roseibium suaedae TaxID=735517 RepID=A0A1M7F0D9_9HYPH|nr:hypothetical protein [Roseibium suaedae]SHL97574.1 Predicted O-linked N-acetylglucosamine transferase, SPINDLY family [Roseibium suaedae]